MQRLKDGIRNRILKVAGDLFAGKGFLKTSMREIAETADVGVGNIYNYFTSKDELFCEVVRPATNALETMLQNHHGERGEDVIVIQTEAYLKAVTDEYMTLLRNHRRTLELLFFHAHGSSLEHYRKQYTDRSTAMVREWLRDMKAQYPAINIQVSDFSIHLHTVWMFALFEEILMHQLGTKETQQIIAEYIRFETTGWKELMEI